MFVKTNVKREMSKYVGGFGELHSYHGFIQKFGCVDMLLKL